MCCSSIVNYNGSIDMQVNLDLSGVEPLHRAVEQLPAAMDDELRSAADAIGERLRKSAVGDAPVDMGQLRSDIHHVTEAVAEAVIIVRYGSNVGHAKPMERGTDPFFPPPDELRGWAGRVLGDPDLAFVVARSIADRGLEAREYLANAMESEWSWIGDRVVTAIKRTFRRVGFA